MFSPRTTFLIKPQDNQTMRLSYNRAYRAPSVINNWLSTVIARPVDLRALGAARADYPLPVNIVGNNHLNETVAGRVRDWLLGHRRLIAPSCRQRFTSTK